MKKIVALMLSVVMMITCIGTLSVSAEVTYDSYTINAADCTWAMANPAGAVTMEGGKVKITTNPQICVWPIAQLPMTISAEDYACGVVVMKPERDLFTSVYGSFGGLRISGDQTLVGDNTNAVLFEFDDQTTSMSEPSLPLWGGETTTVEIISFIFFPTQIDRDIYLSSLVRYTQSRDELYDSEDLTLMADPDSENDLGKIANDVNNITAAGWFGATTDIQSFGYSIDGGETVYSNDFIVEAETAVWDAVHGALGTTNSDCSRFRVTFPISDGTHTIRIGALLSTMETKYFWTITYTRGIDAEEKDERFPQYGFDTPEEWYQPSSVTYTVAADTSDLKAGDIITVTGTVSGLGLFDAIQCVPVYDVTIFTMVEKDGKIDGGFTVYDDEGDLMIPDAYDTSFDAKVDSYDCVAFFITGAEYDGQIFSFQLKVNDDYTGTEETSIGLFFKALYINPNTPLYSGAKYVEATITGEEADDYIVGDINQDGAVSSEDTVAILRWIANQNGYEINQSLDMNRDGIVNSGDAVYLVRHIMSPTLFPLPEKA